MQKWAFFEQKRLECHATILTSDENLFLFPTSHRYVRIRQITRGRGGGVGRGEGEGGGSDL